MRTWRLCRRIHSRFDGEGSRLYGGRWSPPGIAVVYTSGSPSLAAMEYLVHLVPARAPDDLVVITADIPDDVATTTVEADGLPSDWRTYPAPERLAGIGAEWVRAATTAVLRVPSAVVPQESNYLLNPAHGDFTDVRLGAAEPFSFDPRLWAGRRG